VIHESDPDRGLGIMTITSALALALRSGCRRAWRGHARDHRGVHAHGFRRTLYGIVALTVAFEAIGR